MPKSKEKLDFIKAPPQYLYPFLREKQSVEPLSITPNSERFSLVNIIKRLILQTHPASKNVHKFQFLWASLKRAYHQVDIFL